MSALEQRYLESLRRQQFASPQQLAATQRGLLERLVRHACAQVPYYRTRLAPLLRGDEFRPEGWSDVPVVTRADVQSHFEAMQAASVPDAVGAAADGSTSGSSGSPLKFRQSHMAWIASRCQWERMHPLP